MFQSEPLKKPLRLCGPVFGRLCAATSVEDTDWVVALLDVAPDGKSLDIACGAVRARYRACLATPVTLTPNEPVTYDIDMWQTGVYIPPGHRLRIVVLSTLFPDTDRNLNTGGCIAHGAGIAVANQTVFHERDKESYVVLPIVPQATAH